MKFISRKAEFVANCDRMLRPISILMSLFFVAMPISFAAELSRDGKSTRDQGAKLPKGQRVTYEYFNAHAAELTNGNSELEEAIRTSVDATVALLEVTEGDYPNGDYPMSAVINGYLEYRRNDQWENKKAYSGSGVVFHPCYVVVTRHQVNKKLPVPEGLRGKVQALPDSEVSPIGYRTTVRRRDAYSGHVEAVKGTVIDAVGNPSVLQQDAALIRLDRPLTLRRLPTVGQSDFFEVPGGSAFYTAYPGDLQPDIFDPDAVIVNLGCSIKPATSGDGKIDTNCVSAPGGSGGPLSALVLNPKKGLGYHIVGIENGGNGVNGESVSVESSIGKFKIPRGEFVASEVGNFGKRFAERIKREIKDRKEGDMTCPQP